MSKFRGKCLGIICTVTVLAAGMLAGCGAADSQGNKDAQASSAAQADEGAQGSSKAQGDKPQGVKGPEGAKVNAAEGTGNEKAVSVLLLVPGTLGDKSFFDSAAAGLNLAKEHYGAKTKVIEMGTDITKYSATLEDVINDGWDLIITGGVNISQPLQEAAEEYPDQKFILYDESVDFSDGANSNIYCMTYRCSEGGYLAGVLGASVTKTGRLGFAGGFDIPLINDWLVGYIEGARAVRPDIKIDTGYMNSFTDAAKGKEIGLALLNGGADTVFQAAGGAGLGVLDAAKETGKHAIGTDSDQSRLFAGDAAKADAIYASILKRVDISIDKAVGEYVNGTLSFGTVKTYGLSDGCIEITDNQWYEKNVPDEARAAVDQAKQDIIGGKIEVKSAFQMTDGDIESLKRQVQP